MHGHIASQFANSFVVMARVEQNPSNVMAGNTEWVQFASTAGPGLRLRSAALAQQPSREFEVRPGVVGIQLESALVCGLGVAPLPLLLIYMGQQVMCFRNRWI